MAFGFNGLAGTTVTVSGSVVPAITTPSSSQTIVNRVGFGTGASQDAYTVTAGKTFYLYGCWGNVSDTTVYLNDGTTKVWVGYIGGGNCMFYPSTPIATYTAGQAVKVTATLNTWYGIFGVEQ